MLYALQTDVVGIYRRLLRYVKPHLTLLIVALVAAVVHAAADATYEELAKGRELYVGKCGSCHRLYAPNTYDNQTWKENIDEMQERSEINAQQKELIYQYLINAPEASSR